MNLRDVHRRAARVARGLKMEDGPSDHDIYASAMDVPALVDEVRKLRAELKTLSLDLFHAQAALIRTGVPLPAPVQSRQPCR